MKAVFKKNKDFVKRNKLNMSFKTNSKTLFICLALALLAQTAISAQYYVDPVNGSDSNTGTNQAPWKTIDFVKSSASGITAGDTIYLKSGNYGSIEFYRPDKWFGGVAMYGTSWEKPITYKAADNAQPIFESLSLYSHSSEMDISRYLIFEDITIQPSLDFDTIVKITAGSIKLKNINIIGIWGQYRDTTSNIGIHVKGQNNYVDVEDVLIEGCEVKNANYGIEIQGDCKNIIARNNTLHELSRSGFHIAVNKFYTEPENVLLEGNHVYNQWPKQTSSQDSDHTHGTGLSIHCSGVTLRSNIVHNYGNTRGIRFYQSVYPENGYTNMVLENNLVYNIINAYAVELLDIGENCKIINNTIINGRWEDNWPSWMFRYGTSFIVRPCFNNRNGNNLEIYNNIVIGKFDHNFEKPYAFQEDHNIIWGYQESFIKGSNTKIIAVGDTVSDAHYFEGSGNFFVGGTLFDQYSYTGNHSQNLNQAYRLADNSQAIGFANVAKAPVTDIDGATRDTDPDAGCFEYDGDQAPPPDPDPEPDPIEIFIDDISSITVTEGQTVTFEVTYSVTGASPDDVTCIIENLPNGATFIDNDFFWIPQSGQAGLYFLKIVATCQQTQKIKYVSVIVEQNTDMHEPSFNAFENTSAAEGTKLEVVISATDPDGDLLTYTADNLPNGAIFYNNKIVWVPDFDQSGTYTIDITVSDGQHTVTEDLQITISNNTSTSWTYRRLIYYWQTTLSLLGEI